MPGARPRQPWLRVRCGAGKSPRSVDDEAADVGMPAAVRRELPGQWRCCSLRPRRQPPRGPRRFDGRYQRTAWSRRQARGAGSVVLPLHDATPDASGSGERQEDENRGDRAQDGCSVAEHRDRCPWSGRAIHPKGTARPKRSIRIGRNIAVSAPPPAADAHPTRPAGRQGAVEMVLDVVEAVGNRPLLAQRYVVLLQRRWDLSLGPVPRHLHPDAVTPRTPWAGPCEPEVESASRRFRCRR